MKKLVFSAVALVAFTFAGMANNNISVENLDPKCDNIAHDTYYIWIGNGFSEDTARKKAEEAKADCEKELTKPSYEIGG
jgi:hypothetical protein